MQIVTIKESAAFPEIGQLRKGMPKTDKGYVGSDLKTRFRLLFFAGEENAKSRERFTYDAHRGEVEVLPNGDILIEKLIVFLPFPDPFECFDSAYEAYTAGRMVARADGEKFIRWVDTATGAVKVDNGDPYTPFEPGMIVGKSRGGKQEPIRAKATGRLRIVLPELARLAYVTLHTTSIYDIVHMTEQLKAIQWISQYLPGRNGVAGIPIVLSRRMTKVTWSQPDGSAKRVDHGLINLEIDQAWVEKMLVSLADTALPAGVQSALLPSGEEIRLEIPEGDQAQAEEEGGGEEPEEVIEGEIVSNEQQPEITINNGHPRPYSPEILRQKLIDRSEAYAGKACSQKQRGLVAMLIEQVFAGEGAELKRHATLKYLFDQSSLNDIADRIVLVMLDIWLKPVQDSGGAYKIDDLAARELRLAYDAALRSQGQTELDL
jgi:hypothetical protein